MVIWKLDGGLTETCRSLPGELAIEKEELGYANDLYIMIQRERQRHAVVGESCNYPAVKFRRRDREYATDLSSNSVSGNSSSFRSQTSSMISGNRIPSKPPPHSVDQALNVCFLVVSPVAESSRPSPPSLGKHKPNVPSWVCDGKNLRNEVFRSDFESVSPSAAWPPKLDLPEATYPDDENLSIPRKVVRNHPFLQTGFSDHEGLPMEGFNVTTHHSQASLFMDEEYSANRRFRSPMASTRWEDLEHSQSSVMGLCLEPSTSLMGYQDQDEMINSRFPRRSDSTDRPWNRPTGPEPPSSVSCDSGSRHCTPFGVHPRSSFESEFEGALPDSHRTEVEGNFTRAPSPYGFGPIGPNIYKRVSRTPQLYEEKREYTRPNSEAHAEKMLGEIHSPSSCSESSFAPVLEPERHATYWSPIVWSSELNEEEEEGASDHDDGIPLDEICPHVHQPHPLVANRGGHLKDNPLYSSGSEASDCAFESTKRFSATNSVFTSRSESFDEVRRHILYTFSKQVDVF